MKPPTIDRLTNRLEELVERLNAVGRLTKRLKELVEQRNAKEDPLRAVIERMRAKGERLSNDVKR